MYLTLYCTKVLEGCGRIRVRIGYLCGTCGVHEERYEYVVKTIV